MSLIGQSATEAAIPRAWRGTPECSATCSTKIVLIEIDNDELKNGEVMRVLIVEDLPDVRAVLRRMVESLDHPVDEATNREDGIAMLFADNEIGAVLLDLGLPPHADHYSEGIEFLKAVSAHNSLAKAIVLTGHAAPEATRQAIEHGAFDYLEKPIHPSALAYALHRAALFYQYHLSMRESAKVNVSLVADASSEMSIKDYRGQAMIKLLKSVLHDNGFNVSAAARSLNMSREHLYYYLKKYGITRPKKDAV